MRDLELQGSSGARGTDNTDNVGRRSKGIHDSQKQPWGSNGTVLQTESGRTLDREIAVR